MSKKRELDLLYEKRDNIQLALDSCSGFGYFDEERYDREFEEYLAVHREIEKAEKELFG